MLGYSIVILKYVAFVLVTATVLNVFSMWEHVKGDEFPSQYDQLQQRGGPPTKSLLGGTAGHPIFSSRMASGRPSECPRRAWCACFLAHHYGLTDKALWNARHWATIGMPAFRGCIGCVAVLSRGKYGGHVGIVRGYEHGNPIIYSGNHNNAVGVGTYPAWRVIAYRYL